MNEYEVALEASRAAFQKFDAVRQQYRDRKIGDAEFLAARAEYKASEVEFDAAYAKAAA